MTLYAIGIFTPLTIIMGIMRASKTVSVEYEAILPMFGGH